MGHLGRKSQKWVIWVENQKLGHLGQKQITKLFKKFQRHISVSHKCGTYKLKSWVSVSSTLMWPANYEIIEKVSEAY